MTVIRPNSISGINSITAQGGDINVYRADGTKSDIFINNITGVAATFTGNLGVGGVLTYEDVANIDSVGVVTARTDINLGDSIIHIGDTNTKIRFPAADTITAETAGGEALRVDSSQRLLIGTTTEGNAVADKLTINTNSGASGMTIRTANDSNANIFFSDGTSGAAEYAGFVQYAHATDHLALGANGSEKFRIGSAGQFGVGGAAYGSSGQVLTSGGSSGAVSWSTISGTTINNNANNRVITGSGTANTLEGEANLTWDGSSFKATGTGGVTLRAGSTNASAAALYLDGDSDGDWSGATFAHITHDTSGHLNIMSRNPAGNAHIIFGTNDYNAFRVDENRHIRPESDNARDLGTSSYRWRNLYTTDLQLSNKGSQNDVDGTWGNYTIQEGESDLFLINNRNGKKYKFNLTEVS